MPDDQKLKRSGVFVTLKFTHPHAHSPHPHTHTHTHKQKHTQHTHTQHTLNTHTTHAITHMRYVHTHTDTTRPQVVADQVKRMRRELMQAREVSPQIDAIVLLDSSVDFFTPLSTPLTYEALIDEIKLYGIRNSEQCTTTCE